MQASLARVGIAVFAMVLMITFLTDDVAAGEPPAGPASAIDLPPLHEINRPPIDAAVIEVAVAGLEVAPTAAPEDATVVASWYGPGFYGNRTACGSLFTPEIFGVAHLTLPCGTTLVLTYGDRSVTVAVIDRGPYVAGRALDLSNATKLALGCTDLCTLRMRIAD